MKLLHVSAAPGLYRIFVAQHNPAAEISRSTGAGAGGCARERHEVLRGRPLQHDPGSAFEVYFGSGYDLVLLPNFLHHFDHPTNVRLLKKVRTAMKPGALLATIETVPNEDRVSPPFLAAFSMPPFLAAFSIMILASTPAGDAYTFPELDAMFREAGFGKSELIHLPGSIMPLILTRE
jgi:hypothetical protein